MPTKLEIEPLLLKLMSSMILFRDLEREDLLELLRGASKATFAAGEVVFEEGFAGHSMYVVISGRFEVIKQVEGVDAHVAYVEPGEHFGEMALVTDRFRTATVIATERSVGLRLTKSSLFARPKVAVYLLRNMAALMVEHLSEMNNEVLLLDMSRRKRTKPGSTEPAASPSGESKMVFINRSGN